MNQKYKLQNFIFGCPSAVWIFETVWRQHYEAYLKSRPHHVPKLTPDGHANMKHFVIFGSCFLCHADHEVYAWASEIEPALCDELGCPNKWLDVFSMFLPSPPNFGRVWGLHFDALTNAPKSWRSLPNLTISFIECTSGVNFGNVWRHLKECSLLISHIGKTNMCFSFKSQPDLRSYQDECCLVTVLTDGGFGVLPH